MRFFIDTANLDEIRKFKEMGLLDGVTTNPSLVAKEGKDFRRLIAEICEVVQGPVSAEVVSTEADKMFAEETVRVTPQDNKIPRHSGGREACDRPGTVDAVNSAFGHHTIQAASAEVFHASRTDCPGLCHPKAHSFLRLQAMQTKRHSPRIFSMPLSRNWVNPNPRLMKPKIGSTIHFRWA